MRIRKRRDNRNAKAVQPRRLDQMVLMAAYLQESTHWQEWRFRSVSLRKALEMKAAGEAEAVTRKTANGIITFYRESMPCRLEQTSPAALTAATAKVVAEFASGGKMTLDEMSHVEKFTMYPFVGDTKATAVRPRVTDRERAAATKLTESYSGSPKLVARTSRTAEIRTLHFPETPALVAA